VTGKNAEIALGSWNYGHIDRLGQYQALGRNDFEFKLTIDGNHRKLLPARL
jgi:hypothetical protein